MVRTPTLKSEFANAACLDAKQSAKKNSAEKSAMINVLGGLEVDSAMDTYDDGVDWGALDALGRAFTTGLKISPPFSMADMSV